MNIQTVLTRLNIDTLSAAMAVQDVRELVESSADPLNTAQQIINNLVPTVVTFSDPIEARMTAQFLVDSALKLGDKYDPTDALKKAADRIAYHREHNPWFFYKKDHSTVATTTEIKSGVAVEVKADGKMKKGSKQVIARALYAEHKAKTNAEIIAIFMAELDMSKAGATTYLYLMKKESGATTTHK